MYVTEDTADMYIDMAGEKKQLNANQANYLRDLNNTLLDIGSASKPVYFLNGVPVECGTISNSTTGNAATATEFASAQTITLEGDITGTKSSQAGWSITTTLANSGVTANSYGHSKTETVSSFNIPYITVDAKGRITSASNKTITVPVPTLTSLGINASASELNILDGVTVSKDQINTLAGIDTTSTIQTQLNGKLSTTGIAQKANALVVNEQKGSSTLPIYFNASGVPVACSTNLDVSVTGNAATATTATKVNINDDTSSKLYVLGATGTGSQNIYEEDSVYMQGNVLYGAAWNDYAEYRETKEKIQAGHVVVETGNGDLKLSSKRLEPGANIVSDTFGFAIGQTEICGTPIAVCGRVLAYPYEDISEFAPGDPVCAGPNGTISLMSRTEVQEYPDRMIGTVSEIPTYEYWKDGAIKVDGRIWIKVL